MTDQQQKFLELSKQAEGLRNQLKKIQPEINELLLEMGEGANFQDPTDKTVFQVIVPNGTFVEYKKIAYERTKREGEFKGTLSVKKAKELGYDL